MLKIEDTNYFDLGKDFIIRYKGKVLDYVVKIETMIMMRRLELDEIIEDIMIKVMFVDSSDHQLKVIEDWANEFNFEIKVVLPTTTFYPYDM